MTAFFDDLYEQVPGMTPRECSQAFAAAFALSNTSTRTLGPEPLQRSSNLTLPAVIYIRRNDARDMRRAA